MGYQCARAIAWISCIFSLLCATARAIPTIALPFNSQVPTVARINEAYSFQLSDSTFAPASENFTYSLLDQPAWLTVDSASRTLEGMPGTADAGSVTFTLTATDLTGVAQMSCTLVVSADPAPQLEGDISKQIAASANLSSSQPPVVTILTTTAFLFDFEPDSFIDIVQRKLFYYATLADHTPLPAWLTFDAATLTFKGTAPDLSAFPQSWKIDLIASDVAGFAAATASFTIAIGLQQLAFVPQEQNLTVTAGEHVQFTILQGQLYQYGAQMDIQHLKEAQASVPSWLNFDASTLELEGTAPDDVTDASVSVTVKDDMGGVATAIINLVVGSASASSLFIGTVGTITAYPGQTLDYHFPDSLFAQPNPELSIVVPATATWLHFDAASRDIGGVVPTATGPSEVEATLVAKAPTAPAETQVFTINVKARATTTTSTAKTPESTTSASPSATSSSGTLIAPDESRQNIRGGVIAAIAILSLVAAILLILLFLWCCRRKRRQGYERQTPSPTKDMISRPVFPSNGDAITVTTELQRDVEKTAGAEGVAARSWPSEPPPQITLDLPPPTTNRRSRWLKRFSHISQTSSIGNGEEAILADENIPVLGHQSAALLNTPHGSFSVPADMARGSRQVPQTSPSKRALKRLQTRHQSVQSIGLGIDTGMSGALPPRQSSRRTTSHRRGRSSVGLSGAQDSASVASLSTRGTSVLSTRPSDFPRPPTKPRFSAMSVPTLSLTEAEKRRSIRLVARSDSVSDDRPIFDKRQSFIRNRASTSLQSPLFSHGSRASSNNGKPTGQLSTTNSIVGSVRRSRRGKRALTTYSESSSLEPRHYHRRPHHSRRFSSRIRSAFPPNFPRAITQSSFGADDEGAGRDDSSGFYTTDSSLSGDLAAEMALPRHQRSWVLPGEASPTPPPPTAPPTSRQASSIHNRRAPAPLSTESHTATHHKWSAAPLSIALPATATSKPLPPRPRSHLSEPLSLISNDSIHRPRLVQLVSKKRPVSVEEVRRLSSLRAEREGATVAGAEGERWEENVLVPRPLERRDGTDMSGPAFL